MSLPLAYMTESEVTATLTLIMGELDPRLLAWNQSSPQQRLTAAIMATNDIDGVLWIGAPIDTTQPFAWPRMMSISCPDVIDPDPEPTGTESVASLPRLVRWAFAVQAALRAALNLGANPLAFAQEAAHRGVTTQSAGGESASIDLRIANHPWSRLAPEAAGMLARYRRSYAEFML